MPFANLGFETDVAGSPGAAASWTITVVSTAIEYAGYSAGTYEQAWEGFEIGWNNSTWAVALGATLAAVYAASLLTPPPAVERFEIGWNNTVWELDLAATAAAEYDVALEAFENFEDEWSNDTWQLPLAATTTAQYDVSPEGYEDFEEDWNNAGWSMVLGFNSGALYDRGTEVAEDFEDVFPPVAVTVNPSTDTLTAPAHGISNTTLVRWRSDGKPPANINPALDYYVVGATTNTLQVARTVGGAAIDIGDQGSGGQYLLVDPYTYWNDVITD